MAVDSSGNLTLNQVTISDGRATDLLSSGDLGGGIYGAGSSVLAINNSTIVGNSATSGGGIGAASASEVTLTNSTVSGNSAEVGGGTFNDGTLSLNHSTITENTATDNGGGIRNQNVANAVNSGSGYILTDRTPFCVVITNGASLKLTSSSPKLEVSTPDPARRTRCLLKILS